MNRQHGCRSALALALLLASVATRALAFPAAPNDDWVEAGLHEGEPRVRAQLLVHPDDLAADGGLGRDRARIGVLFDLDPGWHLYWRNPGESGLAPELDWQTPGLSFGPVAWPAPLVFLETDAELITYGYEGQVLLASEARVTGARPERIRVDVDLLLCRYECIPARLELERALGEGPRGATEAARVREVFAAHLRSLPVAPEALDVSLTLRRASEAGSIASKVTLGLAPCLSGTDCLEIGPAPAFFPYEGSVGLSAGDRTLQLELDSGRIEGVLALRAPDQSLRHVVVDLSIESSLAESSLAGGGAATGAPLDLSSLLLVLGLALLGGLVLNAMPCVLPVLAIKVFAVTELARSGRRAAARHGFAYLAGIEAAMLVFGAIVISLRAAGTSLGWGFQLQEPLFVAAIGIVLVAFAMNLFGVFEVNAPTGALASIGDGATGARRSFFEGLLAVVLATPCTAPFLGTAVGFAFAAPPIFTLGIFLCIGLGLAAPFTGIALMPGWSRWVPRAGPWMLSVRKGLGFALLATVVWLVWVFGRGTSLDAAAALLAGLVAVAFAIWLHASLQGAARRWTMLVGAGVGVALVFSTVGAVHLDPGRGDPGTSGSGEHVPSLGVDGAWRTYTPEAVRDALGNGQRALVVFTADWCITCKVNERFVLEDEAVVIETGQDDIVRFKADWTRRDERIRAALARFGRAGVPLTVVYHPGAPDDPVVLPELLTTGRLLDALREAPGAGRG